MPTEIEGPLLDEYCDACRWVTDQLELCQVPMGKRFMFCEVCAYEHKAVPVQDIEAAQIRVWEHLKKRVGA